MVHISITFNSGTFVVDGDHMSTSIDCLWLKNEELKAALENQDEVIEKIINRCQNIELKTNEIKPKLITLDNKLLIFMNFMYEESEKVLIP